MYSLFVSSVTLYLSEAALFLFFFFGLLWACQFFARRVNTRLVRRAYVEYRGWVPSERFLARFALFQVAFVAVWSVLFKACLYLTLPHARAVSLMSTGQSLWIAVPAECFLALLVLIGFVGYLHRLAVGSDVEPESEPERVLSGRGRA